MGEDDITGPPKKKLKQAHLAFSSTPKSMKRSLSDASLEEVQIAKQPCSDDVKRDKENVLTNSQENVEAKTEAQDDAKNLSLDESSGSILNESSEKTADESNLTTPKCERPVKKLTPKQKISLANKLEREQRQKEKEEEKLRKKLEKEAKELERKKKEEEKLKKKLEKEAKELDRKKKEEENQKRKLEKEKKRQEEQKIKDEEKKAKEEEKRKKEEAKKLKEEAKLIEEKKEIQAKIAFCNFFKKKDKKDSLKEEVKIEPKFMPFPVKTDMKLAVQNRCILKQEEKAKIDTTLFKDLPVNELYINEIKSGLRNPLKSDATWPIDDEQHDCIIIESVKDETTALDENESSLMKPKKRRAKLYQFHDNRRPPYWGTWRKKSKIIKPKKPFLLDKEHFDYEVDSDSEWEDEGEGEDLDKEGEDSEKELSDDENVGENGYLLDNTFVPHGYLSDEEGACEEEDMADVNAGDNNLKLKVLKEQFEEELKSKTERLKPRLLGCVWIRNDITEVSKGSLYETLMNYRMCWDEDNGAIDLSGPVVADESPNGNLTFGKPNKSFTPQVIEKLVKFVHGNRRPFRLLCNDFVTQTTNEDASIVLTKKSVYLKIKEIATKNNEKKIWVVNDELCKEYGLPNVLEPPVPSAVPITPPAPKDNILTNFLKKPTQPIKKRVELITLSTPKPNETIQAVNTPPPVKKRATLITLTPTTSAPQTVHVDTPRPFSSSK